MVRKAPIGPSRLSKILEHLNSQPKLSLFGLRSIKLSYAFRNDHFGARHFVKEELPRIRFANPTLKVEVDKPPKTKDEHWKPEMEVQFENGTTHVIQMHQKWSTTILKELMDISGGDPWTKWKNNATRRGLPVLPGDEKAVGFTPALSIDPSALPNLTDYRSSAPARAAAAGAVAKAAKAKADAAKKKAGTTSEPAQEVILPNLTTKTGAAAVLP